MKHILLSLSLLSSSLLAQDTSLHDYLIDGEPWKEAASGYAFTDGLCCDAAGNLFFTDVKAGKGIYKIDVATGKTDLFLTTCPASAACKSARMAVSMPVTTRSSASLLSR